MSKKLKIIILILAIALGGIFIFNMSPSDDKLKRKNKQLTIQITELINYNDSLKQQNKVYENEIESLTTESNSKDGTISSLQSQNQAKDTIISDLQSQNQAKDTTISDLQSQIEELERQIEELEKTETTSKITITFKNTSYEVEEGTTASAFLSSIGKDVSEYYPNSDSMYAFYDSENNRTMLDINTYVLENGKTYTSAPCLTL